MTELECPKAITSWIWFHQQYQDQPLWHHCLFAAYNAGARDVNSTAHKMYIRLGGTVKLSTKKQKPAPPPQPTMLEKRRYAALQHINKFRSAAGMKPLTELPE